MAVRTRARTGVAVVAALLVVGAAVAASRSLGGDGGAGTQEVVFRDVAMTVPSSWTIVRFDGSETECVGDTAGTAFIGESPDSESCNLAFLPGPSVWLGDLKPSSERDGAPDRRAGDLTGVEYVDEEDRIGIAFPEDDVYLLVSRSAEDLLDSVRKAP